MNSLNNPYIFHAVFRAEVTDPIILVGAFFLAAAVLGFVVVAILDRL